MKGYGLQFSDGPDTYGKKLAMTYRTLAFAVSCDRGPAELPPAGCPPSKRRPSPSHLFVSVRFLRPRRVAWHRCLDRIRRLLRIASPPLPPHQLPATSGGRDQECQNPGRRYSWQQRRRPVSESNQGPGVYNEP